MVHSLSVSMLFPPFVLGDNACGLDDNFPGESRLLDLPGVPYAFCLFVNRVMSYFWEFEARNFVFDCTSS